MKTRLLLFLLLAFSFANAQNATFSNNFESVSLPSGWASNGLTRITTQSCSGTASMTATTGKYGAVEIVTARYLSDGQEIRLYTNYKQSNAGIIYLQYSIDDVNWINVVVTSTPASICTPLSGIIATNVVPAGTYIRFKILTYNTLSSNVTYNFDDFGATQSNGTLSEYDFNNSLVDKLGLNPFETNAQLTFVNGRDGSTNGAVNLNNFGTTANIPGLPYSNKARTISVWAKTNIINTQINYIFHYGNTANGNGLAFRPSTILYFANAAANLENPFTNPNDTWVHYVCTYDGTTAKVYRNGTLFSSGPKTYNTVSNSDIFRLGLTESGANSYFNGAIDDLKIYNFALTATQVQNLYDNNSAFVVSLPVVSNVSSSNITMVEAKINYAVNANNATTTTTIKYGLSSTSLTNQFEGLIASGNNLIPTATVLSNLEPNTQYFYQIEVTNSVGTVSSAIESFTTLSPPAPVTIAEYSFDNTYNNVLGSAPFASNAGTSFTTDRHGNTNGAININSTGSIATITGLPYGNAARTVSVWAKVNAHNSASPFHNTIFSYGAFSGSSAFGCSITNATTMILGYNNNYTALSTNNLSTWDHYVSAYDGANAKVYKNGTLLGSQAKVWSTVNNSDVFRIGIGVGGEFWFNGAIDDLKIYNYVLTDTEISNLHANNTLSTSDFSQNNLEVALYPNPVNDVLNIETTLELKSVEIYNLQGQRVLSSNQKAINVSALTSGMYMVRIEDRDHAVSTKKIIVK
jgi:hypothetical protein